VASRKVSGVNIAANPMTSPQASMLANAAIWRAATSGSS
jgi:hypothetical protein